MKISEKEQMVSFRIKDIELLEFSLNQPIVPLTKQTVFHFNLKLEQKIIPENKSVKVIIKIEISQQDIESRLAFLTAGCTFEVVNLEEYIDKKTNQVNFPESTLISFNAITISTVRGIMYSQFKGTFLQNAILPVIDTVALMKSHTAEH